MTTVPEGLCTAHHAVQQASATLKVTKSVIKERVSVHTMSDPIPFSSMFAFQKIATGVTMGPKTLLGSMGGDLVFSINTAYSPTEAPSKKKRSRDTTGEDAERAVEKVRRSGQDADKISQASFAVAQGCIADLLRLRGVKGESVIESWAVSLRKGGQWGSSNGKPSLVIAARLAAGVAVPLSGMCTVMRVCRDGMMATSADRVSADFDLPLTDQGKAADEVGQKSILILASVPHLEDATNEVSQ
jgi:hypothetical protein